MQNNEISLSLSLQNELSIVEYKNAQITVNLDQSSEKDLKKIGVRMTELTGYNWNICIDNGRDGIIYGINKKNQLEWQNEKLLEHNLVKKIIEIFPEVEIDVIKND